MISFPNIKINIGLNIIGKRPDGYHDIESIFYPIPFSDVLEIIPAAQTAFVSTGIPIPGTTAQNLCLKAYQLLHHDFQLPPVQIHLHKSIPIGAGLGGGSSDAAFTLKMLNQKFGLNLSISQLEEYARMLGSDCAFFIQNKAKYCFAKGDAFQEIALQLDSYFFVIIYPNIHISTAEAYAGIQPQKPTSPLTSLISEPIENWKETIKNDFEESIFPKYPMIKQLKEDIYTQGALYAAMSGSGSSVFGIFKEAIDLSQLKKDMFVWHSPVF